MKLDKVRNFGAKIFNGFYMTVYRNSHFFDSQSLYIEWNIKLFYESEMSCLFFARETKQDEMEVMH